MATSVWTDTQFTIEKLPHVLKLKSLSRRILKPNVALNFTAGHYRVKTVDSYAELIEVLRLRFAVFFQEFSTTKIKSSPFPYDIDRFDFLCDHLIVQDLRTEKIVACYRLLVTDEAYYTETEFSLDEFLKLPGKKVELGRACVAAPYRFGEVISVLWKGLLLYAERSRADYFFGCCSLTREDFQRVAEIRDMLRDKEALLPPTFVGVQSSYKVGPKLLGTQVRSEKRALNSMMNMYLLAGAKFSGDCAYDSEMDCLDFFTVLDLSKLSSSFKRRFS